jgi:DNA-binding XRE family transcriptional regulator
MPSPRRDQRELECVAFGEALRRLRAKTGRVQYIVASQAKLTRTMLSAYEKGKAYHPSLPCGLFSTPWTLISATCSKLSMPDRDLGMKFPNRLDAPTSHTATPSRNS